MLSLVALVAAGVAGCGAEVVTEDPVSATPTFRVTATIEDIMRSMIDPAADGVWDAVVVEATESGITRTQPETVADWARLRQQAITIIEATNLLLMDGRAVAGAASRSEMPGVDLEPEEIESLLAEDPEAWTRFVGGLRDSGAQVLGAVEARDVDALLVAGDRLDLACEACHARYWYPGYASRTDELPQ